LLDIKECIFHNINKKNQQMKKPPLSRLKRDIILICAFFVLSGQPVEFAQDKAIFNGFLIEKPVIRVGLGINLSDIKISSSSRMNIYEINSRYKLVAGDVQEAWIKGRKEMLTKKFLIKVAQSTDREEAEMIAQELRNKIEQKVYVVRDAEEGMAESFEVRVGDFLTREDALQYILKLNEIGIEDPWILEEAITAGQSRPLWILINDELKSLHDETVLYFVPSHPQSYLSFKGRDYRGLFIMKASPRGIVLINLLNIEDYLKAVVPSELSPNDFHQIEAHKAQAVAARTYALKNIGSKEDLGFDLDDTPHSQYYKGMDAEHPLSSRAVNETRGEVATYKGKLIDALYTSTCGGMTENVEEIFRGPALPYLRGTECVYEKQKEWLLRSAHYPLPIYIEGKNIAPEIVYLISLGVIPQKTEPLYYREEASFDEAVNWIRQARKALGKREEPFAPQPETLDFNALARLIVGGFEWQRKVENLLLESEIKFILKDLSGSDGEAGESMAYLVQAGIYPAASQLGDPSRPLRRGELAHFLWKVLQTYEGLIQEGTFKEFNEKRIKMENHGGEIDLALSSQTYLIRNYEGEDTFTSQLYLLGGEQVRWVEKDRACRLLQVVYPPHSNLLDRDSAYHSWQVRKSKEEMEKRVNQFYPIGELLDLEPLKRGDSRRVIELLINGSKTQAHVKGLRIRNVLGLRETLFVIEREYDESGRISHFIFTGRGWGHGVGLCQVGAFGMARAGAGYKEILKKYYKGIKIIKMY
jgi:stage II sporulation protein D